MPFGEGFRPRQPEELNQQLESTQSTLGSEQEHALVPESQDTEDVLKMSEAELKQKFSRRYEMYTQLLRDQKRVEHGQESALPSEEIEHMKKWLKALNSLDLYIQKHHEGEEVTLRGKQIDVFQSLHNFLEQGGTEGYVKLPTGVGKTVLFTEMVEAMGLKTLIVVPTKILVDQTGKKMEQFAPDLDFGKIYTHAKEHGKDVTIITYSSLVSQLESEGGKIKPEDFDCLILDEAHEALSEKRQEAVGKFTDAIKIGFTATPKFSEKKQVSNLLEKEIHSMTIREAVEVGMLCDVKSIIVRSQADMSNVKIKDNGEYDEKELEKAVNIASRNKAAVDLYQKAFDGQLAVAYCVGIKHAEAVAKEFNEVGVSAACISGETPKKEQELLLEDFHDGKIKVLCNADLLIAGFDEPKASVCLNLRPTQSRIDAEQRGGRVLRLDETKPKKLATIVDFLDKNYSPDKPPVLFADVADGANFYYSGDEDDRPSVPRTPPDSGEAPWPFLIDIEDLEVIYDSEEVMKIVKQIIEDREKNNIKKKLRTTETALLELEMSFAEWQLLAEDKRGVFNIHWLWNHKHRDLYQWSMQPYGTSISDLVAISTNEQLKDNFVFKEMVETAKITLPQLKVAVKAYKNLTGWDSYREESKKHDDWPHDPAVYYKDEWKGWTDFWGKETIKYLSFVDLKSAVKLAGVRSQSEYRIEQKKHKDWNPRPDVFAAYKDEWKGWADFLGKLFLRFEDLKAAVKKAGIKNGPEYKKACEEHLDWPVTPQNYYDEWPGWGKFTEKEQRKMSFDELKKAARAAGITGKRDYSARYKTFTEGPADPSKHYTEWNGWEDFLGKK